MFSVRSVDPEKKNLDQLGETLLQEGEASIVDAGGASC